MAGGPSAAIRVQAMHTEEGDVVSLRLHPPPAGPTTPASGWYLLSVEQARELRDELDLVLRALGAGTIGPRETW